MSKQKVFRTVGLFACLAVIAVLAWQFMPNASAQKANRRAMSNETTAAAAVDSLPGDDSLILLNAAKIDVREDDVRKHRPDAVGFSGKQMHLVRFSGPIQPEWHKMLVESGAEIVDYIPNYTYLVYGDASQLSSIQANAKDAMSPIQWDGPYKSEYKISPSAYLNREKNGKSSGLVSPRFQIQLVKDGDNSDTLKLIQSLQTSEIKGQQEVMHYVNLVVGLDEAGLDKLAEQPDVISIAPYFEPVKLDERQDFVLAGTLTGNAPTQGDYLTYLAGKGYTQAQFDASGFSVDLTDSGIDTGVPATPNEFVFRRFGDPALASRYIYSRLEGTPNTGSTTQGCDGHGNLNASIISGYVPSGGIFAAAPHADALLFRYGLGVAPFVKIGSSVIFDPGSFTSPNYANLQSEAYRDGSRISSNSWGSSSNSYTTDAQAYDALVRDAQPAASTVPNAGNQEMVIVFAAGNNGSGANTVGSPSTGKNVITVAAGEGVQAFTGADGCGIDDTGADSANDIIFFSSRGPTSDGRKKPDITLPGTHISGAVAQSANVSPVSGTGAQLACFTGDGVCGGLGTNIFFPASQQWYTASSGTSHSTPAIAGYSALIRQDFINRSLAPPSPAMTKALIMNTASYMTGTGANDTLPSNSQGMGRANLNGYFDVFAQSQIMRDETNADRFTATGQQRVITGNIASNSKPFKVTLAWTDAPGSTTGNAFVNNLDLEVTVGGNTYKGNVYGGANSATGGSADTRNNVESVSIPAGITGNFVIKVKATNIAGDGVPGNADALDQDFALVAYNANEAALPVVSAGATSFTAESCALNGAIDPAETVTINFGLANVGTANTTNVTATLLATGGVTSPSGPQNYGALVANGAAVSRAFTFTGAIACGGNLVATFHLQDGAADLGNVTFNFTVGVASFTSENFDGVTAPALPAGWVATNATGAAPLWVTSATGADTAPNAAFIDDPTAASDKRLETPAFTVTTAAGQVSFRNNFALESTFDGGVLEVSSPNIASGAYTDITDPAVGGSFASGGYSGTISAASSAINGRAAWTGSSGGFIDTVANLGPNVVGQSIKLRFRMSSDSSVGVTGWRVDGFKVLTGYACCGVAGTPVVAADGNATVTAESFTPPNNTPDPGETVTASFPLKNTGTGATTNLVATLQNSGGITPVTVSQNYGVLTAGGATVSRPFTFVANGACGATVTATLHLQDGIIDLGNVTYTFRLGTVVTTSGFSENFDGVTAPALPAGWSSTATGAEAAWVTSATAPDSAPNDVFGTDVPAVGTTELVTPSIAVPAAGGQLTFRNLYNMEASTTPTTGYDGTVLEISIDGGAYADIITAGGSFVTGGYTRTISGSFSSPIAGRLAWSGLSGGTTAAPTYITSAVSLPPAANGHNVNLKWRIGTDSSAVATGVPGVRIDSISISNSTNVCSSGMAVVKSRGDFDGDGRTDLTVYRSTDNNWYALKTTGGVSITNWGISGDVTVPGDYDNDSKADVAVYRPSTGVWYVLRSSDSTVSIAGWGNTGDVPEAADFDGDGKTDFTVFRPSTGVWYTLRSSDGGVSITGWGNPGDVPVPGNYDTDAKTDVAVFRPSTGVWYTLRSTDGGVSIAAWGNPGDKPVPADYDGDNKDDIAVYRPSDGVWYVLRSTDGGVSITGWGNSTDVPVPGDYDGDGKDDVAVYRDGTWLVLQSTAGIYIAAWGNPGDTPIPARYIP